MANDRPNAKQRSAARAKKYGGNMGEGGALEDFNMGKKLRGKELAYLTKDLGMDSNEVMQYAKNNDVKIGGAAKKFNQRQNAKAKAQSVDNAPIDQGGTPMQPAVEPYGPYGDYGSKGSIGIGGNLEQGIGKDGDMNTSIGDNNTFGPGASIGNDYSVTIGSQTVGGNGGSAGGTAFNNMQSAAAYNALNDNAWAKSQSQLNGYGRAAGASAAAADITGASERVANLYNMTGMDQQYWSNKSTAHQGDYLGDIFKIRAPDWQMPEAPAKIEDNTEEITEEMSDKIDDASK